jgi:hypothetical protein
MEVRRGKGAMRAIDRYLVRVDRLQEQQSVGLQGVGRPTYPFDLLGASSSRCCCATSC